MENSEGQFISESDWQFLLKHGYLRLPGAFGGTALEELRSAVGGILAKYPHGFIHTPPYAHIRPQPRLDAPKPSDHTPTVIIPHIGFLDPRILKPLANPKLHALLQRIVGADFYLSHTWFQMVPPGAGRLSYHKDRRGSINFNILLDDIGPKMGSTCLVPGSHINTPPAQFCMKDMRTAHPREIDMTGNAGDIVFFSSEAWHGRSENNSQKWTRRLFYNFFSRSSRDTTPWHGVVDDAQIAAAREVIPEEYHHMFEVDPARTKALSEVKGSPLKRFGLGQSSSNDLARDYFYARSVYGKSPYHPDWPGFLLPHTSGLVQGGRFSARKYVSSMRPRPTAIVAAQAMLSKLRKAPVAKRQDAD